MPKTLLGENKAAMVEIYSKNQHLYVQITYRRLIVVKFSLQVL